MSRTDLRTTLEFPLFNLPTFSASLNYPHNSHSQSLAIIRSQIWSALGPRSSLRCSLISRLASAGTPNSEQPRPFTFPVAHSWETTMNQNTPSPSPISKSSIGSRPSPAPTTGKRKRNATKYYAVKKGHKPGVYAEWKDCLAQITGFKGAICKCALGVPQARHPDLKLRQ